MASSILLDRNPQYYDIQRHIVPFTDYSPWERRKSSNTRRYSAATRTPTRSRPKTPSKGQTKSAISAKDYLLKAQITAKRKSVEEYKSQINTLLSLNLSLASYIDNAECSAHSSVNGLIQKYQKFKGVILSLQQKSQVDKEEVGQALCELREKLSLQTQKFEEKLSDIERKHRMGSEELNVLLQYKEKEYPLKVMKIAQLHEQIEQMAEKQKFDCEEFEVMVQEEREKCQRQLEVTRELVNTIAAQHSVSKMKRSIMEKAWHNKSMLKAIAIHKENIAHLEFDIHRLKEYIKRLEASCASKNESLLSSTLQKSKCLPDTEFHLDIPKHTWPPV